jgi:hypothetical protein
VVDKHSLKTVDRPGFLNFMSAFGYCPPTSVTLGTDLDGLKTEYESMVSVSFQGTAVLIESCL